MDNFFLDDRDPIFGLIVLISIILLVSVLSYVWGIFHKKNERTNLENFIKKFDTLDALSDAHRELLSSPQIDQPTLGVLANSFVKSGDYERAIEIYLIALNKTTNGAQREFVLTNLGIVYFKAGFMGRAEEVFLEALRLRPRNQTALNHLTVIYERLRRFDEALHVLDALQEQGVDVWQGAQYIRAQIIANDANTPFSEKIRQILALNFKGAKRFCIELFIKNKEPFGEFSEFPNLSEVIDLIYPLKTAVNLGDSDYNALFYALGRSEKKPEKPSQNFEINALVAMKEAGFAGASLAFSYSCAKCKSQVGIFSHRCPVCYEMASVGVGAKISEANNEISQTF
ncbi:tetratricopeptide repeat protein [Campylobacter sp. JMF_08 NE1]|uniref:tetratricopeptide repeat protein n=1 Tax=Campylobacter sp. JMF_08 NE1 TaxID=2983821 RepID=UPI0022EA05A3|nr:tetratricopeptide repeat protein [Campylobacter sp. JMF_08 NE1]MDA3047857.1 tetratricopeptide repeat protein [Campylobacter sp. JMF_08 NE1]